MFVVNEFFHFNADRKLCVIRRPGSIQEIQGIQTAFVSTDKDRIVILARGDNCSDILYAFSLEGDIIFKVKPPEHYSFWYLGSVDRIACDAADEFAEKSPLSGWWFTIDLDTGEMTKNSPAY